MNANTYHLIIFGLSLLAVVALIVTGHDSGGVLITAITGMVGGSGASAAGNFLSGKGGPQ